MTVWNVMDVLEQAYALAGQLGLVHSKAEFSERMLGKGASYLSSMSARQRCPSKDVLLTLESKFLALLVAQNGSTHCGMPYAPLTTQFYGRLQRVYEFVKSSRLVHEAFADGFYPSNDNEGPPQQTELKVIALGYSALEVELQQKQIEQREGAG